MSYGCAVDWVQGVLLWHCLSSHALQAGARVALLVTLLMLFDWRE
jgi:hypothetical protein